MKDLWQYKEMFTKYKQLDKKLKSLIIRAKEWTYLEDWEEKPQVVIDISWEMKIKDLHINDESLFTPSKKSELENLLIGYEWFGWNDVMNVKLENLNLK